MDRLKVTRKRKKKKNLLYVVLRTETLKKSSPMKVRIMGKRFT